jgi:DNA-binding transcriptional ArsR family regulator
MTVNSVATDAAADTDAVLSVLADGRRRTILRSLEGANGNERSLEELAAAILDDLSGMEPNERPSRQTILTELYHTHLPTLEEMELVVHDREDEVVWSDAGESALELLDVIEQYEADR